MSGATTPGPWAQLWMLREDAMSSPDFTFRGPAVPVITELLRVARDLVDPELATAIEELMAFAGLTDHYPTDALAELLGRVLTEDRPTA